MLVARHAHADDEFGRHLRPDGGNGLAREAQAVLEAAAIVISCGG